MRPGHARGRARCAAATARPPTVPVERTTQPVASIDLFEIWNVPTRDRARLLLNELGIGAVARGEDLNAILRRANPSLQAARRTIAHPRPPARRSSGGS